MVLQNLIFFCFIIFSLDIFLVEGEYLNLTKHPGSLCTSKCIKGETRVCYYHWTLEYYHALGPACYNCEQGVAADCFKPECIVGDGHQKGVMSINRMIPGPPINVCEGDQVVIDVLNTAQGSAATIHWHGLHMIQTPWMDGVPYVTQCPIAFDTTFRYFFNATQPGTHFYHSHAGMHKLNGQYGALIIRQADENNPQINEYDVDDLDHYILISDWRHDYGENSFPGLPKKVSFPDSLLINGLGTYVKPNTFERNEVPVTTYYVHPGRRYKFNLINSISLTCSATLQIEKHKMRVIATDSYPIEPLEVDTLISNAGERYDFVVDANKEPGDYWIRVRGVSEECQKQPTDSFAILRYINKNSDYNKSHKPFPSYTQEYPIGISLNDASATCFRNDKKFCAADMTALEMDPALLKKEPDYKFKFGYTNHVFPSLEHIFKEGKYVRFDNPREDITATALMNNISLEFPPQTILTQYSEVDKSHFCERSNCPEQCDGETYRQCIHIIKVKTNSIVEVALYDEADVEGLDHPFHLHGFRFAVMGMTHDTKNLTRAIKYAGKVRKNRPVLKDTVSIPMNSLVVLRFRANNPGIWLMHCHYELHMLTGMGFLFQVGEPNEWVQAPKGFPKCRNYMPGVERGVYSNTKRQSSGETVIEETESIIKDVL